jgi:hypothetical protein
VPPKFYCLYIIYLTSTFLTLGRVVVCTTSANSNSNSNNNNNINSNNNAAAESDSENYGNHLKKMPSGSGAGANFQKRSSYAVISQAMSETLTSNEFGSKCVCL